MSCFKVVLFVNVLTSSVLSARILGLFPIPSISHQVVFRQITNELVNRGHYVTVMTTDPVYKKGEGPKNFVEIDVHDLSYGFWREQVTAKKNGANSLEIMSLAIKISVDVFEKQINSTAFKEAVNNSSGFDLILTEGCTRQTLAFSEIYKAPVVQVSSFGSMPINNDAFGIPAHPLLYPLTISQKVYNRTLWDKIREVYNYIYACYMIWDDRYENEMLRRNFGENMPSVSELSRNVDLLIINMNSMWHSNRPVPPGVVHVSGLHMKAKEDLPEDLKSFLGSSQHGVIYMSFGTNFDLAHNMPGQIDKFNKVFSRLPYDVIWKCNQEDMPGKAPNVRLMKWVPQADLLHHPKIRAFITHAGLQSTDEIIAAKVPVVALPTASDQWYNAQQYVHHKIGIQLDLLSCTEDQLYEAVKNVIEDKSYRENIEKLSKLMKDTPSSAVDTAVWWIEYVARNRGAKHLRSSGAGATWMEFLMLDVLLAVILALFLVVLVVWLVISSALRRARRVKSKTM